MFKHILAVLAAVAVAHAITPVYTSGVNYENLGIVQTISSAAAYDTLVATDSINLVTTTGRDGAELFLVRDAITGGGSDSVAVQVMVDALDGNGNLLYRTIADSLTAAAGEAISLPAIVGAKMRIKRVGYTGNGGVVILNRIYLAARRVINFDKVAQ